MDGSQDQRVPQRDEAWVRPVRRLEVNKALEQRARPWPLCREDELQEIRHRLLRRLPSLQLVLEQDLQDCRAESATVHLCMDIGSHGSGGSSLPSGGRYSSHRLAS